MNHGERETDNETSKRPSSTFVRSRTEDNTYKYHCSKEFSNKCLSRRKSIRDDILSEFVAHKHTRGNIGEYHRTDDRTDTLCDDITESFTPLHTSRYTHSYCYSRINMTS
mgnify:CR=1 FL=1